MNFLRKSSHLCFERADFSQNRSAIYAFFAASISTFLGTLACFRFINQIDHFTLGILLVISTGSKVYVGATHLLPEVEKENKKCSIITLVGGIIVAVLIMISKGNLL